MESQAQESTSHAPVQKANEEGWKLKYDIYKHLTTLNTGSVLLLVTFLEKLFKNPRWKGLVIASFCLFLASLLASMVVMNILASAVQNMKIDEAYESRNFKVIVFTLATFLAGVISLVMFAVINLYLAAPIQGSSN